MKLQQYLPFTVLKHVEKKYSDMYNGVATVLTVYGIETLRTGLRMFGINSCCNSTYRLRY